MRWVSILAGVIFFVVSYYLFELYWLMSLLIGGLGAAFLYSLVMMINGIVDPLSEIVSFDVDYQRFSFTNEEYQLLVMELNRNSYYQSDQGHHENDKAGI